MPQTQDFLTKNLEKIVKKGFILLDKGVPPGEFFDMNQDDYEAIYARGYQFYEQNRYQEATQYFAWLILNADRWNARYYHSLGASQAMVGRWDDAVSSYGMAVICKPEDTTSSLDAADCLLHAEQWKRASKALETYRHQCASMPKKVQRYEERFKALQDALQKNRETSNDNRSNALL